MDNSQPNPAQGDVDLLGREYSEIIGFSGEALVPLGSRVKLLPNRFGAGRSMFSDHFNNRACVVVGHAVDCTWRTMPENMVLVKLLTLDNEWEPYGNGTRWDARHVLVESIGDGQPPVPGKDFPLSKKEIFDERFASRDHRFEGFSNPATYLAHLYLRANSKHFSSVCAMKRANGTVNPVRVQNYFAKQPDLSIDEWARYPDGFPEQMAYYFTVDWVEVAGEFNTLLKEEQALATA
jgi:hypothetical protein